MTDKTPIRIQADPSKPGRKPKPKADPDNGVLLAHGSGLPLHFHHKDRFRTSTLAGIRAAMGKTTSAVAHGRLDADAGRGIIWMLQQTANVLEKERATEALHRKLDKLETMIRDSAPELGRELDIEAIRRDIREAEGGDD